MLQPDASCGIGGPMRLAWLTDIHLNFLHAPELAEYVSHVMSQQPDGIIISGDIAEAHNLEQYLMIFEDTLGKYMPHCKVFFVLGNHDYYKSDIKSVRAGVEMMTLQTSQLIWMPYAGILELSEDVALVGHDGWCDGRFGNIDRSIVRMADFHGIPDQGLPHALIHDFAGLMPFEIKNKLRDLGLETANHIRHYLPQALESYEHVIFVTHIPPFREASTYRGKVSDDNWAPYFTCKSAGEALLDVAADFPDKRITVLCGHTHSSAHISPSDNLEVYTGHAAYKKPTIQKMIEIVGPDLVFHKPKRRSKKKKPK